REQRKTLAALDDAQAQRELAERRLAESYLDRGLALCEQQDAARGMLWLARALQTAPADASQVQRVIRANLTGWQRQIHRLRGVLEHQDWVRAAAFSPDGKTVLTGSQDNTARLWQAATGKPLGEALRHQGWVVAVAFSPDGKLALTGGADETARLW